ncbi:MFS transporter [Lentzea sp. NBRC 105346]|uniref:MFS transporter n=1 Tax=Lentzea sp. NBRC 105346 TaxID=3032205 RepID=UPI0024A51E8D|nr:MFS transporter [Lentzea sp. NBRC 105346]GLZ29081.1 MFS transporter [Lentzea sp. NBRC 105346]
MRNTAVLVAFTAVTNLADGITKVALPLLATTLTSSPLQVSGVALTLTLPWLLAALPVGVLVDRMDRRRLLWVANAMRLGVVAILLTGVSLPVLYAGGLTLGVAEVIALTSAAALVPDAVPPVGRERANAWVAGAETLCNEFCGPFLGGLLVAAGTSVALGATAAGYVLGIGTLLLLVGRFRVARTPSGTVGSQLSEGLKVLWRNEVLRLMSLVLTVLCACWGAWLALMPLVATTAMGLDAGGYGVLLSALGVGGLVGALAVTTLNRVFGRHTVMVADLVGTAAMVGVPAITGNTVAVAVAAFLGGLGGTVWSVNSRTIAQELVPSELMGRFSAAAKLFSWGAMPVGAAVAGLLAEWFDFRVAFGMFAVAALTLTVPFLRARTAWSVPVVT